MRISLKNRRQRKVAIYFYEVAIYLFFQISGCPKCASDTNFEIHHIPKNKNEENFAKLYPLTLSYLRLNELLVLFNFEQT